MESKFKKVGILKVKNGEYSKDGKTKTRYNDIGVVFATPHHSKMSVKFHSSGSGEGSWAYIFWDENTKPDFADKDNKNDEEF